MLSVNDIAVTYGGVITAVDGVSLQVPENGVVALLGANGAGKTTMLRAITGLLRLHGGAITRGSITFDGKRIDRQDATRIVRLGIAQVLEGRASTTSTLARDPASPKISGAPIDPPRAAQCSAPVFQRRLYTRVAWRGGGVMTLAQEFARASSSSIVAA